MIEQPHLQRYFPGYLRPDGAFVRNMWADGSAYQHRDTAIVTAQEYADQGNETLAEFGVDAQLRPAIVLRKVYYGESEPEVVE